MKLKDQIKQQKTEINDLRGKIEAQKEKIKALEFAMKGIRALIDKLLPKKD